MESKEDAPIVSEVEAAYHILADRVARALQLEEEESRLQAALEACEADLSTTQKAIEAARLALIDTVMEADPRPMPTIAGWHYAVGPLRQVRSGRRIFALIPRGDMPHDDEKFAAAVSVAIVTL